MQSPLTDSGFQPALVSASSDPVSICIRILFAEDGRDNQRLISMQLKMAGAEVVIAENGQSAIEQATKNRFALILMDMQMPVLDGFNATEQIRQLGMKIPIIALTAYTMLIDRTKCVAIGCDDYLAKPVDRQVLLETINLQLAKTGTASDHLLKIDLEGQPRGTVKSRLSDYPGMGNVIAEFVAGLPAEVETLRSLLNAGEREPLRLVVHHLRGACARHGFDMAVHSAEVAEKWIQETTGPDFIQMQIESMIQTIQRIDGYGRSHLSNAA